MRRRRSSYASSRRIKRLSSYLPDLEASLLEEPNEAVEAYQARQPLVIPDKFQHVDLNQLAVAEQHSEELKAVLQRVHPFSSLHWGYCCRSDGRETLPRDHSQILRHPILRWQILSPMTKGSLGTHHLNETIQQAVNPAQSGKAQLQIGGRLFREGDRVIQRRNNYTLNVFNGDIGRVIQLDSESMSGIVAFTDDKEVAYEREHLPELELAYAITIHKSQGQ